MLQCLIVAAGGAAGAVLRYLMGLLPMNPENGFPLKTFLINVIGAFVIGLVATAAAKNSLSPRLVLFLKVGICGGFTTFSSFVLETEALMAKGQNGVAVLYVILSLSCGILAVSAAEHIV